MAVTLTVLSRNVEGVRKSVTFHATGDVNGYLAGGYALTAAQIRTLTAGDLSDLSSYIDFRAKKNIAGKEVNLDPTNGANKLIFYAASTEVANATDLSAVTCRATLVYGGALGT